MMARLMWKKDIADKRIREKEFGKKSRTKMILSIFMEA
jgi:hypothetical protein